ncbi:MAG: hypothetical protein GX941_10790 [Candidatus Methanofastidiosa archaeon]|nr:hypothetical protein [Candidatus Methanofastidiosa archaeon]
MKIAIIGMGVAGISVLREWTKEMETDSSIELTVFGDQDTFGTGVPYQKDNENLLMNVPAEFTTIIPEREDDFVDWLKNTQDEENPRFKYYPRQLFGTYLTDRMKGWLKQSKAKVIKEKVETIGILPNKQFRLTTSYTVKDFDAVHLCIGNLPYKDPYNLIEHPNFIINPFPMEKNLSSIPDGAKVGVLGTGLTSIDIFRYSYYNRSDLKVSFFSNSGRFKSIGGESKSINYEFFTKENIKKTKENNMGFISLETYIKWFKKEIENQELDLNSDWIEQPFGSKVSIEKELEDSNTIGAVQSILLDLNPLLTDLWMALTETDKQIFLDKYYGIWDKLRSSFPAESGKKLISAWGANKINVFGNISNIVKNKQSFKFILKEQKSQQIDYIINAIGTEKNVSFKMNRIPLLHQLLNERILQPETFGGVQVTLPDLSAVSQKYGVIQTMKIHGELISGIQFGNNSVDIISESARSSVKDIVQHIKD